jgi:NAD(P)-dependent dehydrogenase (short-subunit alcohol dehydrogenase family)
MQLDVCAGFDAARQVAEAAIACWGRIDVVVNNAGILDTIGYTEEIGYEIISSVVWTLWTSKRDRKVPYFL